MAKRIYPSDSQHVTFKPRAQDVQMFCKPELGLKTLLDADLIQNTSDQKYAMSHLIAAIRNDQN